MSKATEREEKAYAAPNRMIARQACRTVLRGPGSDMEKVDAHVITRDEYEDDSRADARMVETADLKIGDKHHPSRAARRR